MFIGPSRRNHRRLVHWTPEQSTTGEVMTRWKATLAAAAASATVAGAVVALPALGSDSTQPSAAAVASKRAACLQSEPAEKCKRKPVEGPELAKLIACVRDHGLDAPTDPTAFKAWVARTEASDSDAIERVIPACKMALAPPDEIRATKEKLAACGAVVPKGDDPKAGESDAGEPGR
jgi:hypothetical protein